MVMLKILSYMPHNALQLQRIEYVLISIYPLVSYSPVPSPSSEAVFEWISENKIVKNIL